VVIIEFIDQIYVSISFIRQSSSCCEKWCYTGQCPWNPPFSGYVKHPHPW